MKHTTLSKSKLRSVKLRRRKAVTIASKNINDCVNNMPKSKPIFDLKNLTKVVFGKNDEHYVQKAKEYKVTRTPQPKRLHHSYKKWKWIQEFTKESGWITKRVLVHHKSEYFHEDIKPINNAEYMEKLVQHKLKKWDKKNPKPQQDLFDKVEEWENSRTIATERIRDFVVSLYDKLAIVGNYVDRKNRKVRKKVVATIRDIHGKGHNVNYPALQPHHKLYTNAVKAAKEVMKHDHAILDCDLMNHKRDQARPLLITRSLLKQAA